MNASERRRSVSILLLAWLAYIISYLGRTNYGSCILAIVAQTGISRSLAGMVASVFSLFYAIGQIGSGVLLKRFRPVTIIGVELFTAACINLLFPMSGSVGIMMLLWGLNGCVQSTVLCCATQIFVENLKEPYLSRSAVIINTVGAVGGVLNYILTWAILTYSRWQTSFALASVLLFTFALIWIILMPRLTAGARQDVKKEECRKPEPLSQTASRVFEQSKHYGALLALAGCFFIGLLREGVAIWIPSYINDTFQMGAALSTVTTVVVPMFQVTGALLGGRLGRIHNIHVPVCALFIISSVCMLLLPVMGAACLPVTLAAFAANAVCMTAAMTLYLSLFPLRFYRKDDSALVVGLSSFSVHAGDFCAASGIGLFSELGGWTATFGMLTALALFAAALSAIGSTRCRQDMKRLGADVTE